MNDVKPVFSRTVILTEASAAEPVHIKRGQHLALDLSFRNSRQSRWQFEGALPPPTQQRLRIEVPVKVTGRGAAVETTRFSWTADDLVRLGHAGKIVAVLKTPTVEMRRVSFDIFIDD